MTKKEAKRLEQIFQCIINAYMVIDEATEDRRQDIEFVFGTSVKPKWAPEDHVHIGVSGEIYDITFNEEGKIRFRSDRWRNFMGEKIYGCIAPTLPDSNKKSIFFSFKDFAWHIHIVWERAHAATEVNLEDVCEGVLAYLVDNFNVEAINSNVAQLKHLRGRREFGLELKTSYFMKKA